jgi:hypothetical protein
MASLGKSLFYHTLPKSSICTTSCFLSSFTWTDSNKDQLLIFPFSCGGNLSHFSPSKGYDHLVYTKLLVNKIQLKIPLWMVLALCWPRRWGKSKSQRIKHQVWMQAAKINLKHQHSAHEENCHLEDQAQKQHLSYNYPPRLLWQHCLPCWNLWLTNNFYH